MTKREQIEKILEEAFTVGYASEETPASCNSDIEKVKLTDKILALFTPQPSQSEKERAREILMRFYLKHSDRVCSSCRGNVIDFLSRPEIKNVEGK